MRACHFLSQQRSAAAVTCAIPALPSPRPSHCCCLEAERYVALHISFCTRYIHLANFLAFEAGWAAQHTCWFWPFPLEFALSLCSTVTVHHRRHERQFYRLRPPQQLHRHKRTLHRAPMSVNFGKPVSIQRDLNRMC